MTKIFDLEIEKRAFDGMIVVTGVVVDPCVDNPPVDHKTGEVVQWVKRRRITISVFQKMAEARRFVKEQIFQERNEDNGDEQLRLYRQPRFRFGAQEGGREQHYAA